MVKSVHEPLISESLFLDVQRLLNKRQRQKGRKVCHNNVFPLRGFLKCPYCNRRVSGSYSQGKTLKYRYYHCATIRCKGRFRSDKLENAYEEQLRKIRLRPEAHELFSLILEDENIPTVQKEHLVTRNTIINEISKQEILLNKARNLFVAEKIDENDFNVLKQNCKESISELNDRLSQIATILIDTNKYNESKLLCNESSIFQFYKRQDISGKRYIIDLLTPAAINLTSGSIEHININKALAKILDC